MKKYVMIVICISFLIFNTLTAFCDLDNKLDGHWAKDYIDEGFMTKHFGYLVENDFREFLPEKEITKEEFEISLDSLLNETDMKEIIEGGDEPVERKDAVKLMIDRLEKHTETEINTESEISFNDIEDLNNTEKESIKKAVEIGLINGFSEEKFMPHDKVTQVQAIILLKRLEGELDMSGSIPFKVVKNVVEYNGKEGVDVETQENKVIIKIVKEFPTSGYGLQVEEVKSINDGEYNIYLRSLKANAKMMQAQVISYSYVTIEINKEDLNGDSYKFNTIWNNK